MAHAPTTTADTGRHGDHYPDPDGHQDRIRREHRPLQKSVRTHQPGCTCGWSFTTTHATHLASLLATVRGNLAFTARGWMP
jgi:hypothetical protein